MLVGRAKALLKTSVELNGVHMPFNNVIVSFSRFCRPLTLLDRASAYELSLPGSAFAIRYLGINFVVSSLHQFGIRSPADFVIIHSDAAGSAVAIPGTQVLTITPTDNRADNSDICLVHFPDQRDGRDMKPKFCSLRADQIRDEASLPPGSKVVAYITCGFPSKDQIYETGWNEATFEGRVTEVRSRWSKYYLELSPRNVWDRPHLTAYKIDGEQMNVLKNPDGLSGSPIIMLWQDSHLQAHCAIAGMVLYGSIDGRLNALPAAWLERVLADSASNIRSANTTAQDGAPGSNPATP